IVGYHNGDAVKLSDFANVVDSVEDVRAAGFANGKPSVLLVIFKQPQANVIDAVDRIKQALPALKASIPQAIDLSVMMDRTTTIRASVRDVEITLAISVSLVILVVFLFLRNVRATMIPGVAVPVSLIGTFGIMYLCHYSLDNLSLMAMTISTGFVVDDAIVVIENITRHLEQGMPPMDAALRGAREIGFTVVSISLSLVTVFTPILLMGGIVGRLFREFAVTLSVAIIVSLGVSLTTTPMMCSRLLKPHRKEHEGKFYRATGRVLAWMLRVYERSLSWVLRHPAITLTTLIVTIALNVFLFITIPKGFFPQQDTGIVFGQVLGAQNSSFQAMQARMLRIVDIVKADAAVANVVAFTGGGTGTDTGRLFIALKPGNQRDASADQVIARLRRPASKVAGATMYLQASQDLRIGGRSSPAQYQYTVWCDNLQDLVKWGPIMLAKMKKLHGLTDVNSDQRNDGLQAHLVYDRATAMRMGITPQALDSTLYGAFGQDQVSTMYTSLNQYHVVMEVAPKYWQTPEGLSYIYLPTANSGQVPLSTVTHFEAGTAPIAVNHQGQFPSVTVSFNLAPGMALSDARDEVNKMKQDAGMPASIRGDFSGTLQAFTASLSTEPWLIAIAIVAVYIVLGVLYESYIHPITILSTLPSAGLGAVLALMFCHTDLSIIALIGIILLIGIVKKNAILMIDFALDAERTEGKSSRDAIFQACLLRFRPILMTTMAAMLGAMPLVVGLGTGSELRRPLGIAIVGGLAVSQVLTLYTTPVVYLYLDRVAVWWRQLHGKPVRETVREVGVNP
ncbi:MAG: efflux RND transporter permease subunit, partial [Candidatus Brocadiia bacterium]